MSCFCGSFVSEKYTCTKTIPFDLIYKCALMSKYAYSSVNEFTKFINKERIDFNEIIFYDAKVLAKSKEDTQVFVVISRSRIYIIFRGTEDIKDILADLDVRKVTLANNVTVHRGFYHQFVAIEEAVSSLLEENHEGKEIIFCGHSLGGALATFAAVHFAQKLNSKKIICITFGSPRVGCVKFVKWFDSLVHDHWRVSNKEDAICNVPFTPRFLHTNNCISLCENNYNIVPKDFKWYKRMMKMWGSSLEKHACDVYISRIKHLNLGAHNKSKMSVQ